MEIFGLFLIAYLIGSFPTTFLVGKLMGGIDLRRYGSGNVGVTNVAHHLGKRWAVPLVLFEMAVKGASPVAIGRYGLGLDGASLALAVAGLLTVAGNNWSVFLKFQGGRGLAAVGGTLLVLSPLLVGAFGLVFIPGWYFTRSSGVWALLALALLPAWAFLLGDPSMISWYCIGAVGLIILKRLVSNWTPFPQDIPRKKVLFNRFFRDRDLDDRTEWIQRVPGGT